MGIVVYSAIGSILYLTYHFHYSVSFGSTLPTQEKHKFFPFLYFLGKAGWDNEEEDKYKDQLTIY